MMREVGKSREPLSLRGAGEMKGKMNVSYIIELEVTTLTVNV